MRRLTGLSHAAVLALSCLVLAAGLSLAAAPTASASTSVTVRVVIERVDEQGCTDNNSGSDFYGQIVIAGEATDFGRIDGDDTIEPNWTAEKVVDADAASSVPVVIRIGEFDTLFTFGDDACDISRNDGTELDLVIPLIPCSVTGEATGACATSIFTGGSGGGQGDADLNFRVEVDPPAATPGLTVRCTHSPLWPQPGDNVTITVESLDGTVQVGDTQTDDSNNPDPPPALVDRKKLADSLQVWVGDRTGPDIDTANKSTTTFVVNNVPAGDLLYGCRVKAGADTVFTGWRRTRVGAPAEGKAVPVLYLGDRSSRADIVFIPDMDSYSGASDPNFLSDVGDVIKGAHFGQDYFLANQQNVNFWLADQTGDADRVAAPTDDDAANTRCVLTPPANWADDYSWGDSGAILHRDRFRDCANPGNRVFSTEPTSLGTVLHETGHSPFGLADEYWPGGGYFKDARQMFDTQDECEADAITLPGRSASDCRKITDSRPTPAKDWWLSEPTPNDLMNADRHPPQAADIRQMDLFFTNCRAGSC